jgi:hypothetical protein
MKEMQDILFNSQSAFIEQTGGNAISLVIFIGMMVFAFCLYIFIYKYYGKPTEEGLDEMEEHQEGLGFYDSDRGNETDDNPVSLFFRLHDRVEKSAEKYEAENNGKWEFKNKINSMYMFTNRSSMLIVKDCGENWCVRWHGRNMYEALTKKAAFKYAKEWMERCGGFIGEMPND